MCIIRTRGIRTLHILFRACLGGILIEFLDFFASLSFVRARMGLEMVEGMSRAWMMSWEELGWRLLVRAVMRKGAARRTREKLSCMVDGGWVGEIEVGPKI